MGKGITVQKSYPMPPYKSMKRDTQRERGTATKRHRETHMQKERQIDGDRDQDRDLQVLRTVSQIFPPYLANCVSPNATLCS